MVLFWHQEIVDNVVQWLCTQEMTYYEFVCLLLKYKKKIASFYDWANEMIDWLCDLVREIIG